MSIPIRKSIDPVVQPEQPKYPTDTITLPTKGWLYPEDNPLSSGEVELKQMTAREEDILANADLIRKGKVLEKLLQSLLVNKNIDVKSILTPDENGIFIAIRRLAYGDSYKVGLECPGCRNSVVADIDLSKIENKGVDVETLPKGVNRFSFKLPKSGAVVEYKILSKKDGERIDTEIAGLKKIQKDNPGEITTRLKYVIVSVNGNSDDKEIRRFVDEELLAADSRALREHIRDNTPDIDMKFDFVCPNCDLERRLDIPLGASFLWPDIEA